MKDFFAAVPLLLIALVAFGCAVKKNSTGAAKGMKDVYLSDFLIGAALNSSQIEEKDAGCNALILQQFNAITAENCMKAEKIHPAWDRYDFTLPDKLVAFSNRHKLQLTGHTLIWHSQLPRFAHQIQSVDSFRLFFTDHIKTVASRYAGKIHSWDVVNEALEEDGTLRNSILLKQLGPEYIIEAFRLAFRYSPDTELYYNDFNIEQPLKRAGCLELVKKIKAAGVRIDGVGIQGHWHLGKLPFKEIEESILAYHALGLKVMITELDIDVLPGNFQGAEINLRMAENPALNPYKNGIPDSILQQQAADYENLFKLLLKHKDKISRVSFWGVDDGQSWLNGWPVRGRTNYPLLFDRQLQPKPAYNAIMRLKTQNQ